MKKNRHNRAPKTKAKLLTSAIVLICFCIVAGGTLAYLVTGTYSFTQLFGIGQVLCQVERTLTDGVPQNVTVKNSGNVTAYIRAAVVANWVMADGNIYAVSPVAGEDYTIEFNTSDGTSGWIQGQDGFWYYTQPVEKDDSTAVLITECNRTKSAAPAGCTLSVQIAAEAIQSVPDKVVAESWASGVEKVEEAVLEIKTVQEGQ